MSRVTRVRLTPMQSIALRRDEIWPMGQCELRGYGGAPCDRSRHLHHIISRHLMSKYPKAKKYAESHDDMFIANVCGHHNAGTKEADHSPARQLLVYKRVKKYGNEKVAHHYGKLQSLMFGWYEYDISVVLDYSGALSA